METLNRLSILTRAIEQRDERRVLLGRGRIEGQNVHQTARRLDLVPLLLEDLSRVLRVRKEIGAIAQQSSAGGLQRPPDAHPQCWIAAGKIGDEQQPGRRSGLHGEKCYVNAGNVPQANTETGLRGGARHKTSVRRRPDVVLTTVQLLY